MKAVESHGSPNDWLEELARNRPREAAVIDDRGGTDVVVVTFSGLNELAYRLANAFLRHGVRAGDRIAWCCRNSTDVLALAIAAQRVGARLLALNHQLRESEMVELVSASQVRLIWAEGSFGSIITQVQRRSGVRTVVLSGAFVGSEQLSREQFLQGAPSDHIEDVFGEGTSHLSSSFGNSNSTTGPANFTAGTTGRPRGILYDRSLVNADPRYRRIEEEIYGPEPNVFITSGSLSHAGPLSHTMAALARGGTIVLQRKFDPVDWLRLVSKYSVTASYCPPTVIRRVCAVDETVRSKYDLSSIRVIVAGAAKWSFSLKLAYREVFPPDTLWEIYGSSELGSNIVMRPDEHWDHPESCGRPIPGYEIVLRDDGGDIIDRPRVPGVMYVKGPYVAFIGYEGDPAATMDARWGDYWSVGDVAYFDEDGYYYISDRSKDMFISGGVNVYPAEIEAVLESYPGVFEAAVFGIPDEQWGECAHALIVPRPGVTLNPEEVRDFCQERLAPFKTPREIELVDDLPHTPAGKISKRELRQPYWAGSDRLI